MKSAIEYALKSLPLVAIGLLSYWLFLADNSLISEGMKLSLSALLGGIASYIFIQYSDYLTSIEQKRRKYQNALANLEYKLNDQLNWVSDVIYHLENHERVINKVLSGEVLIAKNPSSYRESINIESEALEMSNLGFMNQLLKLIITYKKIGNDIKTIHDAYNEMTELAASNEKYYDSYRNALPLQLENTIIIRRYTEQSLEQTKDALSKCRVLSVDSRTIFSKLRRYLVIHDDPDNLEHLLKVERKMLDAEIQNTLAVSTKEKDEIVRDITNKSKRK